MSRIALSNDLSGVDLNHMYDSFSKDLPGNPAQTPLINLETESWELTMRRVATLAFYIVLALLVGYLFINFEAPRYDLLQH